MPPCEQEPVNGTLGRRPRSFHFLFSRTPDRAECRTYNKAVIGFPVEFFQIPTCAALGAFSSALLLLTVLRDLVSKDIEFVCATHVRPESRNSAF